MLRAMSVTRRPGLLSCVSCVVFVMLASCKKDPPADAADAAVEAAVETASADAAPASDASTEASADTTPLEAGAAVKPLVKAPTPPANKERDDICLKAKVAKDRQSPAAGQLEAKCKALGGKI